MATLAFGQKVLPENDRKPNDWQKMKDCAIQAEKVGPNEAEANKGGFTNHYSPKYDRCYIRISWITLSADQSVSGQGLRLLDAFEHDSVAVFIETFSPPQAKAFCMVDDNPADCSKAKGFIAEHMQN